MQYNERKRQVLGYIMDSAYVTSQELSSTLDITRFNAAMLMKKYHDWGLLRREKSGEGRGYAYNISLSGEKRLEWLLVDLEYEEEEE